MAQKKFGSKDTIKKLEKVSDYANFYTQALKNTPFKLHYVDVFAGTGEIPMNDSLPLLEDIEDIDNIVVGSATRSLEIRRPFDSYIFADIKRKNTENLAELKEKFPLLEDRIKIKKGEANETVKEFCKSMEPNDRALIFLDPFGNQVNWDTLKLIAETQKVDLFYLFPAGLGVVRQISNLAEITPESEKSLNRIFGSSDWEAECVRHERIDDLFDQERFKAKKIATPVSITRYMINKMNNIFGGGVSESWLPLGKDNRHNYSLLFACSNPNKKARDLALRVVTDVLKRK